MKKRKESVSCVIFDKKREHVLLLKRRDIPVWVLPGGGIDPKETPETAVIREACEETGLQVAICKKVAVYRKAGCFTHDTHFFECISKAGELTTGNETAHLAFFPLKALPKRLVPFYEIWIEDALKALPDVLDKAIEKTSFATFLKYLTCHPLLVTRFLLTRVGIHLND